MFTGIIEEVGKVISIYENKITIQANTILDGTKLGDSISVNGVCLTVTGIDTNSFDADISPETMKVTAFRTLNTSSLINLERALPAEGRFGGHIVTGHIDGTGKCISIHKEKDFYNIAIEVPAELTKYIVKKGSITINGISLTVADINNYIVKLAIIPHTYENTNLKALQCSDILNIETDILARYIEKFLLMRDNKTGISMNFLIENGFC